MIDARDAVYTRLLRRCPAGREAELRAAIEGEGGEDELEARAIARTRSWLAPGTSPIERAIARAERWSKDAPPNFLENVPASWWTTRLSSEDVFGWWRARGAPPVQLYAHVPFCRTRCAFCQCDSIVASDASQIEAFVCALEAEASAFAEALGPIDVRAITVGGGTPSHLDAAQLGRVLACVARVGRLARGGYYSVELNPDSTSAEKIAVLVEHGVGRVSLGVQSFHEGTLVAVARGYQRAEHVEAAVAFARPALSVALDLIAPLPLETEATFDAGARRAFALGPDELVLYRYQPVRRGDRVVVAGELSWSAAADRFARAAAESGYVIARTSSTSVIAHEPSAPQYTFRYTQHAPEPRSTLGLGVFAESHVFAAGTYRRDPDGTYRGAALDLEHERASQLGRHANEGVLDRAAWRRTFGAEPEAHRPAAWAYLSETGALTSGDRIELHDPKSAWLFVDGVRLRALRSIAREPWPHPRDHDAWRAAERLHRGDDVIWDDIARGHRLRGDGAALVEIGGALDVVDPRVDRWAAMAAELELIARSIGASWRGDDLDELRRLDGEVATLRATLVAGDAPLYWEIEHAAEQTTRWRLERGGVHRAELRTARMNERDLKLLLARRVPPPLLGPLAAAQRVAYDGSVVELSELGDAGVEQLARLGPWSRALSSIASIDRRARLARVVIPINNGEADWERSWLAIQRDSHAKRALPLVLGGR
jgi:hypothetical protein